MLLPIIILPLHIKKTLYYLSTLVIAPRATEWLWNFPNTITNNKLYISPFNLIDTFNINFLIKGLLPNRNENFLAKYCYEFAFYKEKHQNLFQQMDAHEREQLLREIKSDYREILVHYFTTEQTLKEKIDKFINAVFCANIPVPQIIEMHMELIDEFSKQLRLEGRSDETLLDYRLTLIDILAHLCETYRCSIYK
ncbi:KaiA family protein [Tolypothrix tenuis PCC 7101]|uniref:Circadian clock oscillator protein KaiA n=1 Tax=Tolypothrix tenuis PCC 7101 TaxID=231146 RepID=A0A1Z4N6Y3_9CYAN|nr:KaiA family protein [Aulosira sp. FACHB-113]BAZ01499.1 KaiA family protein [Tolypothrix tenuis PCC 7101]BAZ74578.1 KaiA family protein [Aulosira laxa NIES-50]